MAYWRGGSHVLVEAVVTILRWRCTTWGGARRTIRRGLAILVLIGLMWWISPEEGASETCTAPPPRTAPPAAQAASFANAIRTDMIVALVEIPKVA